MGLQQRLSRVDLERRRRRLATISARGAAIPGEPMFLPARTAHNNEIGDEDDGIVVTLVYDSAADRTSIVGLTRATWRRGRCSPRGSGTTCRTRCTDISRPSCLLTSACGVTGTR